jgi:hypothetical protein
MTRGSISLGQNAEGEWAVSAQGSGLDWADSPEGSEITANTKKRTEAASANINLVSEDRRQDGLLMGRAF